MGRQVCVKGRGAGPRKRPQSLSVGGVMRKLSALSMWRRSRRPLKVQSQQENRGER